MIMRIGLELIVKQWMISNNIEAKKAIIHEFDWAEEVGYTLDNPDFQILYLANADSTIYDSDGNVLAKYQF